VGSQFDWEQSSMTAFRAAYADLKIVKTRGVAQLILEIPLEQADAALEVLGGVPRPDREVWCAVARLAKDAPAEPVQPEEPAKERRAFHEMPLPQQAGLLCKDFRFQAWCGAENEMEAIEYLRHCCGVSSRADLPFVEEAGSKFLAIVESYRRSTGLEPEPR
jgi:hypothetical protein